MKELQGIWTALITPFREGAVDIEALRNLVRRQLEAGVHGLVACGTTGETPTLSLEEYRLVIEVVLDEARGRIPVVAGTGTNSTTTTIERTRLARGIGVDAALVVTPYYNKPQQKGLMAHYEAVAREGGLPLIIYNVPGRTGVNILPETVAALAQVEGIVGIKEASGSVDPVREIVRSTPPHFAVLSGDDGLALASWALGAKGLVSVASNIVPEQMVAMWEAFKAGDIARAKEIDRRLAPLYKALFLEPNPVPCKAAAKVLGLCPSEEVRLPLVPASEGTKKALYKALEEAGVLA